jgi:hypothetical protein
MHEFSNLIPADIRADEGRSPGGLAVFLFVLALLAGSTGAAFWVGAVLSEPAHQPGAYQVAEEVFP